MSDRVTAVALGLVAAGIAVALGVALLLQPPDREPGGCPTESSEAQAVDTFAPGLTAAQRAWGIVGGTSGRVRPGLIAAFAWDSVDAPQSVITVDPATGARCTIVKFVDVKAVRANITHLDWSPTGDALAIGVENPPDPAADGDPSGQTGQVLVWTPNRLLRVWSGHGQTPGVEWAPDGRSIAVWMDNGEESGAARIIAADGSPDRRFALTPSGGDGLAWSPDGSRWIVALAVDLATTFGHDTLAVVDLLDGRAAPVDAGVFSLTPEGWIDVDRVLLRGRQQGGVDLGFLDVPLADPASYTVVPFPAAALYADQFVAFSPDWRHAAYDTEGGGRQIADLSGERGAGPVRIEDGGGFAPGYAWAPDGSQLAFTAAVATARAGAVDALWIVNTDGTGLRQVAEGGLWTMDDPWQPVPVR